MVPKFQRGKRPFGPEFWCTGQYGWESDTRYTKRHGVWGTGEHNNREPLEQLTGWEEKHNRKGFREQTNTVPNNGGEAERPIPTKRVRMKK